MSTEHVYHICLWMSFEGPASSVGCSIGCSVGSCSLNGLVRHDPGRKLLLGFLKTSTGGAIERVHLWKEDKELVAINLFGLNLPKELQHSTIGKMFLFLSSHSTDSSWHTALFLFLTHYKMM